MLSFFCASLGFVIGAVMGSFATAIIFRVPKCLSIVRSPAGGAARSECPQCKNQLRWPDLLPILSWVCLAGRCRYCGGKIGVQYVVVELLSALCGGLILFAVGLQWQALYFMVILPFVISFLAILFLYKDFSMLKSVSFVILFVSVGALFCVMIYRLYRVFIS